MPCGNSTLGIQDSTHECKCDANSIIQEKSENGSFLDAKECVVCSDNTIADSATNTCESCPDPAMVVTGNNFVCTCPDDYQAVASSFMDIEKQKQTAQVRSSLSRVLYLMIFFSLPPPGATSTKVSKI
ncbi:Transmembrane protein [Phytophthora cinnamomi]|uniref:Transmembrane protein n=1 Tax=Phytophthora cinnamomi TaxID=4785 RepID=UPI00355950E5|nr:Transmembrane protein [Phytophthora cinnamomi]